MKTERGRPPFKPTAAQRKRVALAAGAGMSHEEIGLALGIHRHTLSKHFEHELTVGAYRKRLEAIEGLHRAAKKGGAAAAKAYLSLTPKVAAPPAPKLEKIGKKAQAAADAQTAHVGSDWETLLQPTTTVQ